MKLNHLIDFCDKAAWESPKEDLLRWHKDRVGELWFACWKDRTWCQKISQKRSFDGARSCTLQFFLNRKSSFRVVGEISIGNTEEVHGYSSCWRRFFGTAESPQNKVFQGKPWKLMKFKIAHHMVGHLLSPQQNSTPYSTLKCHCHPCQRDTKKKNHLGKKSQGICRSIGPLEPPPSRDEHLKVSVLFCLFWCNPKPKKFLLSRKTSLSVSPKYILKRFLFSSAQSWKE